MKEEMEGITASVCKGLKEYWRRRGYQRINGSGRRRMNRVKLGSTGTRKGRFWRWRIKLSPKIRIHKIPSPKKLLVWVRDAYVRMMLGLANSQVMTMSASASGFGGGGDTAMGVFGRAPPKEYDEKTIVQIYKSLLIAHGHLVPLDEAKIASVIDCRR
ncbi:uncharacterized protein LOC133285251 [Gastrolobium bilobum]|uniref:uncharacterized protein LOC133285251 n=1 Tax=Gastrolobium bilobum TaxID=150636 RepID=UPI002AB03456|nr:uncharacterized protein LOC133285251 [Gastrolobium bilobum]